MKNGSCLRDFAVYSSLNIMGMIGLSCYILADTYFISQALGADGLTALNLAIPVYSFIHGSGLMIGMGGSTRFSIFRSQNKTENACQAFSLSVFLTVIFSCFFLILGITSAGFLIRLLGADNAVFGMGKTYLQILLLFSPLFLTNNLLLCFIRNDGGPQLAMAAMTTGSLSNILLDYIFMFPLGMGISGAALATGFAPLISIGILSSFLLRRKNHFHLKKCLPRLRPVLDIFSGGLPSLVTEVSSGIVIIIFNIIILDIAGNTGVAAYGVIANLSLVVIAVYTGTAQGIQPLISRYYGAGNRDKILATLRYALITVLFISAVIYLCIFSLADPITAVFNSGRNELLQEIASGGLKIYFAGCVWAGFNIVISVYFTSTEAPVPAHLISLLRGFIVIIPMAFLLSSAAGINGVWASFPVTEFGVSVLAFFFFISFRL